MARYRDVKGVTVFSSAWTGVQDVALNIEAENFNSSGDDKDYIERIDVTKLFASLEISILDPSFKRDIYMPSFGSGSGADALNEVLKASLSENCDVIKDSSEADLWIVYLGITKRMVEGNVELRDISQLIDADGITVGHLDTFTFKVLKGAATTAFNDPAQSETLSIANAVITSINTSEKHGDLASGTINFMGYGNPSDDPPTAGKIVTSDTGSVFDKHVGDSGTISFIAKAALGGTAGDKSISVINCVCTKVEITAQHGGRMERKFSFEAYSSDGSTSPITIS